MRIYAAYKLIYSPFVKATRDWDDILQREEHGAEEAEEGDQLEETADDASDADTEEEISRTTMPTVKKKVMMKIES